MSARSERRKQRNKGVNAPPDIYMRGDALDQLLDGGMTRELAIQLDRATPRERRPANDEVIGVTWAPPSPLHLTLYRHFCTNCGKTHDTFGFLSRRVTEKGPEGSTITRYAVVAQTDFDEKPKVVEVHQRSIPYCHLCMVPTSVPSVG